MIPSFSDATESSQTILLKLLEWEKAIENGSQEFFPEASSTAFKSLLSENSRNSVDTYIRVKYNDLSGDFRAFVTGSETFGDLANKKMLLANACPNKELAERLNRKIEDLIYAASYDFKRSGVVASLGGSSRYPRLHQLTSQGQVVPKQVFDDFLESPQNEYRHLFSRYSKRALYSNLTECNLVVLSKYFKSISFRRIEELLGVDGAEDIAAAMIVQNKFPQGTKIDQLRGGIFFQGKIATMNDRIRDVGVLVNEVTNGLANSREARVIDE